MKKMQECSPNFSTFSLNNRSIEQQKAVIKLITNMSTYGNHNYLSEAYLKIMDNDYGFEYNAYATTAEKNKQIKRAAMGEISEARQAELVNVWIFEDGYEAVEFNADCNYRVEEFLDMREKIFFSEGVDIYILLALLLNGYFLQSGVKTLQELIKHYDISELLKYIIKNKSCFMQIREILE